MNIALFLTPSTGVALAIFAVAHGLPATTPFEEGMTILEFLRRVDSAQQGRLS